MSEGEGHGRLGTAAENVDPSAGEPRQRLVREMAGSEDDDALATFEVLLRELTVRPAAEAGEVAGADAFRVGEEALDPGGGAAPGGTRLRLLREHPELPHHLGLPHTG